MKDTIEIVNRQAMLRSGEVTIEMAPLEETKDKTSEFLLRASIDLDKHKVKSALRVYQWYFLNGGIRSEQEVRAQLLDLDNKIKVNRQNIETANLVTKAKLLLNQIGYIVARQEVRWILGEEDEG